MAAETDKENEEGITEDGGESSSSTTAALHKAPVAVNYGRKQVGGKGSVRK